MLYICLSFDHELFLGENFGTEKEILIDTTEKLLQILNKHQVSGTFFTDICSIIRYLELGIEEFPKLMNDQLKLLIKSGQDVQLHIHSNWLKSHYLDGKWEFDIDSYRIQYFTPENSESNNGWTMRKIIKAGKDFLEQQLQSEKYDYKCIAYRAGGFCIQPEYELISSLIDNGILIDSSIAPGIQSNATINNYDFKDCPKKTMNWFISPQTGLYVQANMDEKNKIFEIPIATAKREILNWIMIKNKYIDTKPHLGRFISAADNRIPKKQPLMKRIQSFLTTPMILSLDYLDAEMLKSFIKQIYKKYKCNKTDVYISLICHPKLVNEALLENLDRFIKLIKLQPNVQFLNMREVYEKLMKEEYCYDSIS